ncbi:MAG: integration host factor subunit beta [Sphaerochaetaceae bacterium]|jgi:integration host factor subunit alpha|nr:integration host factor subunit beta [Sphaerochaetaceae bacterium]
MNSKNKLTKAEIIVSLNEKLGLSKNDIHLIIDGFFEEVKAGLMEDKTIELRGFGTFEIKTRKGKENAHNPKSGQVVSVQTHGAAIFRPGKEIADSVWDLRTED